MVILKDRRSQLLSITSACEDAHRHLPLRNQNCGCSILRGRCIWHLAPRIAPTWRSLGLEATERKNSIEGLLVCDPHAANSSPFLPSSKLAVIRRLVYSTLAPSQSGE